MVRQFTIHQNLEMGIERVRFPIRVEVEYQQEGIESSQTSLRKKVLYNKTFLLKTFPQLQERDLDTLVEEKVQEALQDHLIIPEGTES